MSQSHSQDDGDGSDDLGTVASHVGHDKLVGDVPSEFAAEAEKFGAIMTAILEDARAAAIEEDPELAKIDPGELDDWLFEEIVAVLTESVPEGEF